VKSAKFSTPVLHGQCHSPWRRNLDKQTRCVRVHVYRSDKSYFEIIVEQGMRARMPVRASQKLRRCYQRIL
jgi:hypothetical protein